MNLRKAVFVLVTMLLSAGLTGWLSLRTTPVYKADIQFQIAGPEGAARPDLTDERELILSDALLSQVLKDKNVAPKASEFRGFELGSGRMADTGNAASLEQFRDHLTVKIYPDNSAMALSYTADEPNEARQLLGSLFQKYRNWRQNAGAGFDGPKANNGELASKRETFLRSQKEFMDYAAGQGDSDKNVAALKIRQHDLAGQIESLQLRYGPKHPAMVEALRAKETVDGQLTQLLLQGRGAVLKSKMADDFRALDEAIKSSVSSASAKPEAFKILALGDVQVNRVPSYIYYKMALAAFAAFLLSLFYAHIRESFTAAFESRKELAKAVSHPVWPGVAGLFKNGKGEMLYPSGAIFDDLKTLRHEVKLQGTEAEPIKLITFTSSLESEGISEMVTGFGRVAARAGDKVLILDADLRSPDLHRVLPSKATRNLVDYLSGQARVEDVIIRTDPSGAHAIYATAIPNTALDLLSSEKMKKLLLSLREVYDLVLVAAPPSARGPDARILGALSDQVIYLVKQGQTSRRDVMEYTAAYKPVGNLSFLLVK